MARKESTSEKSIKAPTHGVFVVEGHGEAAFWTRVGAAWAHQDGHDFNLNFAAVALSCRLVVRANKDGGK